MKGVKSSFLTKRAELRLLKKQLSLMDKQQAVDMMKILLSSPAIQGLIAFGLIETIKIATAPKKPDQTLTNPLDVFKQVFGSGLENALGPLGSLILGITGVQPTGQIGWDVLEGAVVVYVATGGNLTGLIGTVGSVISAAKVVP